MDEPGSADIAQALADTQVFENERDAKKKGGESLLAAMVTLFSGKNSYQQVAQDCCRPRLILPKAASFPLVAPAAAMLAAAAAL